MLSDGRDWSQNQPGQQHCVWTVSRCCGKWGLIVVDHVLMRGVAGCRKNNLQFVQEVVQNWDAFLQPLCFCVLATTWLGGWCCQRGLREGSASGQTHIAEKPGHLCWISGWQWSQRIHWWADRPLHKHGGVSHLGLLKDMALLRVQDSIDTTNYLLWTLDFHKVDRIYESGWGS